MHIWQLAIPTLGICHIHTNFWGMYISRKSQIHHFCDFTFKNHHAALWIYTNFVSIYMSIYMAHINAHSNSGVWLRLFEFTMTSRLVSFNSRDTSWPLLTYLLRWVDWQFFLKHLWTLTGCWRALCCFAADFIALVGMHLDSDSISTYIFGHFWWFSQLGPY